MFLTSVDTLTDWTGMSGLTASQQPLQVPNVEERLVIECQVSKVLCAEPAKVSTAIYLSSWDHAHQHGCLCYLPSQLSTFHK